MRKLKDMHGKWMCDELEQEYSLTLAVIQARGSAGVAQEEVAPRMKATHSTTARMEAPRTVPSTRTLERFAQATGTQPKISFQSGHA